MIDGVGHRRLVLPAARQEIQNSSTRSALVPSGTARERPSSVRRQLPSDESLQNDDDGGVISAMGQGIAGTRDQLRHQAAHQTYRARHPDKPQGF